MSNSIRLSEKHGLNPTLCTCFWCGKENGTIALLGKIGRDDAEAPHRSCVNLEPCAECRAKFSQGVHLIEVTDDGSRFGGSERFALKDSKGGTHWPTGRFAIICPGKVGNAGDRSLCNTETMDYVLGMAMARKTKEES